MEFNDVTNWPHNRLALPEFLDRITDLSMPGLGRLDVALLTDAVEEIGDETAALSLTRAWSRFVVRNVSEFVVDGTGHALFDGVAALARSEPLAIMYRSGYEDVSILALVFNC